jgi:hypothetical protein
MRRVVPAVAAACLLAGPTVIAFWSGGYFAEPRVLGAIVAWLVVLALTVAGPAPLPRRTAGWIAVAGLTGMLVWTAISLSWAPLGGPAIGDVQRLALYLAALLAAIGALRAPKALRAVEPALAAGAAIVLAYGLAGRLLPGVVHLHVSAAAGGRLEQPITYWNGEGALAAVGLVLTARIAGDLTRPRWMRALAAGCGVPLAAGVYLSYSRGAIAVAVVGLLVVLALAPSRAQLRASAAALVFGVAAAVCAQAFPGVASLGGTHRERDGAIVLAVLVVLGAVAAALASRPVARDDAPPRWARAVRPAAVAVVVLVAAGLFVGGLREKASAADLAHTAGAGRLTNVSSNRYDYWRVALDGFADHPLQGVGAAGFRVLWLKRRSIEESVRDTHSIEFEMAAELGLVGLLTLALLIGGTAAAAREALRRDPTAAAGLSAALLAWLLHASIDWDWQLPAVSLPAIALAGALIALSER